MRTRLISSINLLSIILFFVLTVLPSSLYAQTIKFDLQQPEGYGITALHGNPNFAEATVQRILVNTISIFYAVGGLGVVIYFIWGAVDWILSGGDKEKVANARKKMTHAIIGLVLLSLSYVIINIIGQVVGFNPLGNLQLRGLGAEEPILKNQ